MGCKYEVLYYDYYKGEYISYEYTNSFLKALFTVHKLKKTWRCVSIKFRRNKVKVKGKLNINFNDMTDITCTDGLFE